MHLFKNHYEIRPAKDIISYLSSTREVGLTPGQLNAAGVPKAFESVVSNHSNVQLGNAVKQAAASAGLGLASGLGIPQVSQVGSSLLTLGDHPTPDQQYAGVPFQNLNKLPGLRYQDFRARKGLDTTSLIGKRLDGTGAASRKSETGIAYAATSATVGAYSLFNLEATYGFGDHGNIWALRNDFTARSHVATKWIDNEYKPTRNPIETATAFRGDKVQVIDFGERALKDVYKWKPGGILGAFNDTFDKTQDLIKFFFTGPSLVAGSDGTITDDIIVFRAIINSLTDTFSPSWTPQQMIGRADPNYLYSGVQRDLNIDFTVYATSRDEMKPIWRKLNALASYTAPEYDNSTIGLKAPWMRLTIGDILYQQPVIIQSIYYTLADAETTWEINIEKDPDMMEAPKKIEISLQVAVIPDYLPQKKGRMYTLAKDFNRKTGEPIPTKFGNWLADTNNNTGIALEPPSDIDKQGGRNSTFKDIAKNITNHLKIKK